MFLFVLLAACATHVPTVAAELPTPQPVDIDTAGPWRHEAVVSATWAVPRSGLIDLNDPKAASLEDGDHAIVLPVHVLTHPTAGVFVIDTGVPEAESPLRGLVGWFAKDIAPVTPLAQIVRDQQAPLAAVLLTHAHLDHVLGLPDVPLNVPVYAGPGEEAARGIEGRLVFPTFARALGDRPLTTLDPSTGIPWEGFPNAIDLIGDGSLWALPSPGHTPGSMAYLARTVDGPLLFTGDCSHTQWGWDHGVPPGTYTEDQDGNVESLAALKQLVERHPNVAVYVGHELPD